MSPSQLTAALPASDLAAAGNAKITVTNPTAAGTSTPSNAESFTIAAAPASTTWVRSVGIAPQSIAWDATHRLIYASIPSTDTTSPNTIIAVNPFTGKAGIPVPAGNNPNLLSISSDASYLWVGLDGAGSVHRFQLPALTPNISFKLPNDYSGAPQQAVSLEAARVNPHAIAVIAGHASYPSPGNGIYVYDDATPRPNSLAGNDIDGGFDIDWLQWGGDDSTLFGTSNHVGVLQPMKVTSAGVVSNGTREALNPINGQYVPQNGLLYSYGAAYDPVKATQTGQFNTLGVSGTVNAACTVDFSNRTQLLRGEFLHSEHRY